MNWKSLTVLAAVVVLSLFIGLYFPAGQVIRDLASVPAIGALLAALFLLLREHIAHDRTLVVHQLQASSTLGIASHMATVAFDKHVAFSEEYFSAATRALSTLALDGPRSAAAIEELLDQLTNIRRRSALWIDPDLSLKLERDFEEALCAIGYELLWLSDPANPKREAEAQSNADKACMTLFGYVPESGEDWSRTAIDDTLATLQVLLGSTELTRLRSNLVTNATQAQRGSPE